MNISEQEKEDYYKPVRVGKFWSRNYIEFENNGDKNKALSIKENLNKIRPYLTLFVYIFHAVLEKLFFGLFVCREVAKQNLIEKVEKNTFS